MRRARVLATVVIGVVALVSLSACTKPVPNITILSGSTTVVVSPQAYCPDTNPSHCHTSTSKLKSIGAVAGTMLLVDVPRQVADKPWLVRSATQKANNTFSLISGGGYSSGIVKNTHSARVAVPYGVGSYFLLITEAGGGTSGSWVAKVSIKN
jgi:hypothetical protein